jgi:hypothetical protein
VWWINRILHAFGWALVLEQDGDSIVDVYPARCRFRGFSEEIEDTGFKRLSRYLHDVRKQLVEDSELDSLELSDRKEICEGDSCSNPVDPEVAYCSDECHAKFIEKATKDEPEN